MDKRMEQGNGIKPKVIKYDFVYIFTLISYQVDLHFVLVRKYV